MEYIAFKGKYGGTFSRFDFSLQGIDQCYFLFFQRRVRRDGVGCFQHLKTRFFSEKLKVFLFCNHKKYLTIAMLYIHVYFSFIKSE